MKANSKKLITFFLAIFLFFFNFSIVFAADTNPKSPAGQAIQGLEQTAQTIGLTTGGPPTKPEVLAGQIVSVVLGFVGVLFLILVIYGGIMWMTAGGNEEKLGKAKQIITAAAIGLVIILAAYIIVNFVFTSVIF